MNDDNSREVNPEKENVCLADALADMSNGSHQTDGSPLEEPKIETEETAPEKTKTDNPILDCSISGETLQDMLGHLQTLVDEVKVNITTKGMMIRVVDPSHIAMCEAQIPISSFETWRYEGFRGNDAEGQEMPSEIGLDIDKIGSILKALGKKALAESLHIRITEQKMIIETPFGDRKLHLLDCTGMSDHKVPTLNLPSVVYLESKDFPKVKGCLKLMEQITDHIRFSTSISDQRNLKLYAEGDMDTHECQVPVYGQTQSVSSLFPLEDLKKMLLSLESEKREVRISLGNDYPIKLECESARYTILFLLAPRIETAD